MKAVSRVEAAPRGHVDPVTAQVIWGALENIAIEMGHKLTRMSYSSIIRESEDFGAALIDMQNRQLAEAKQSTPLQSGPIPGYVRVYGRDDVLMPWLQYARPFGSTTIAKAQRYV